MFTFSFSVSDFYYICIRFYLNILNRHSLSSEIVKVIPLFIFYRRNKMLYFRHLLFYFYVTAKRRNHVITSDLHNSGQGSTRNVVVTTGKLRDKCADTQVLTIVVIPSCTVPDFIHCHTHIQHSCTLW